MGSVVTVVVAREGRMRPGEEGTKAASCQDSHASPLPHLSLQRIIVTNLGNIVANLGNKFHAVLCIKSPPSLLILHISSYIQGLDSCHLPRQHEE